MLDEVLNNLPILKSFQGIKRGDVVYSKQYGIGTISSLYRDDEIIVQFSNVRKRLSVHDGISKIPEKYLQKPKNTKIEVVYNGKNISFKDLKRKNREEKKRLKLEEQIQREERKRARLYKDK